MREIDPSLLKDETTSEILNDLDAIKLKLLRFKKVRNQIDFLTK